MSFAVDIPVPPSLNNAYFNKRLRSGKTIRVMRPDAREWKRATAWLIKGRVQTDQRIVGAYDVLLELPAKMRGDSDNRLKLAIDSLVMSGRVSDDVNARETTARKCLAGDMARITVRAAPMDARDDRGKPVVPFRRPGDVTLPPPSPRAELRRGGR